MCHGISLKTSNCLRYTRLQKLLIWKCTSTPFLNVVLLFQEPEKFYENYKRKYKTNQFNRSGTSLKKPDTPFRVEPIYFLINFFFKAQELKTFIIYRVTHAKDENSETIVRILFIPFPCI